MAADYQRVSLFGGLCSVLLLARYHRRLIRLSGRCWPLNVRADTRRPRARKLLHFLAAFIDTLKLPWQTLSKVFALTCVHWLLRYSVLYLHARFGSGLAGHGVFLVQMLSLGAGQFICCPVARALRIDRAAAGTDGRQNRQQRRRF